VRYYVAQGGDWGAFGARRAGGAALFRALAPVGQLPAVATARDPRHGVPRSGRPCRPGCSSAHRRGRGRGERGRRGHDDPRDIELRLQGTLGRRRVVLHSCDRITLRDGKVIERVAHLDPAPLMAAVKRTPRIWPQVVRAQRRAGARAT
jgi:hypothetical protein